jgi:hypothetical protein
MTGDAVKVRTNTSLYTFLREKPASSDSLKLSYHSLSDLEILAMGLSYVPRIDNSGSLKVLPPS